MRQRDRSSRFVVAPHNITSATMIRSVLGRLSILAATLALSTMAHAQYANHGSSGQGWEGGFDLVYQNATTLDFDGGSKVNTNTDWGLALTFGYRFSTHLEVLFGPTSTTAQTSCFKTVELHRPRARTRPSRPVSMFSTRSSTGRSARLRS